eukprot:CAMPEP_0206576490 /NCGR_PEP_ID=MMETSP0325_2-20121206/30772_1 /ASSEMBLY_ACC=CAM_ASM_000347 /TAXON_ID=2866 /ORGANISM="Crypthecodinium cohnii, Strain Seligo" /LENGTH=153 /DNA_ID=CAMNT_0054081695 /DNA_START=247 /DNA_END=708 /DNA_ORIENTATION=-
MKREERKADNAEVELSPFSPLPAWSSSSSSSSAYSCCFTMDGIFSLPLEELAAGVAVAVAAAVAVALDFDVVVVVVVDGVTVVSVPACCWNEVVRVAAWAPRFVVSLGNIKSFIVIQSPLVSGCFGGGNTEIAGLEGTAREELLLLEPPSIEP